MHWPHTCCFLRTATNFDRRSIVPLSTRCRGRKTEKGFREKPKAAQKFFRSGKADQWRDILTSEQVNRIVSDHRAQMERFNYWPLSA